MAQTQRTNIQALLSADPSPLRAELLRLGFDALAGEPLSGLIGDPGLAPLIYVALTRDNAHRVAERHLLPAAKRIEARLAQASEMVGDTMPESAKEELLAIVRSGKGPRFGWMKGAIDPADLRLLFAPTVQQVLVQFTTKLPIPGAGGGGQAAAGAAALTGMLGMLGKQVSKSASQLADVGKSVMGGIGSELERRMQAMARDFSQTAMTEFRTAIGERIKSDEGQEIIARIRDRAVAHVLSAKLGDVVTDFMHLPLEQIASMSADIVEHVGQETLFKAIVESEIQAALDELGKRTLLEVLDEAKLLDPARDFCMRAVEPGLVKLVRSDAFGDWLDRLLAQSAVP